jgi:hypothetical protein
MFFRKLVYIEVDVHKTKSTLLLMKYVPQNLHVNFSKYLTTCNTIQMTYLVTNIDKIANVIEGCIGKPLYHRIFHPCLHNKNPSFIWYLNS